MDTMRSASEPTRADRGPELIIGLAALAAVIQVMEVAIPSPVPGVKPGLANVITLIALLRHGPGVATAVAVTRVVAASLYLGTFLSPGFLLSAAGALAALAVGTALHRIAGDRLSAIGLAAPMALAHMTAQLAIAWVLLLPGPGLLLLAPPLLSFALVAGLATGIIADRLVRRLEASVP
jgi:heptaprenyl diphosphate synthase